MSDSYDGEHKFCWRVLMKIKVKSGSSVVKISQF